MYGTTLYTTYLNGPLISDGCWNLNSISLPEICVIGGIIGGSDGGTGGAKQNIK